MVIAEFDAQLEVLLPGRDPQFVELVYGRRQRRTVQSGQCRAAPQCQRVGVRGDGAVELAGRAQPAGVVELASEGQRIELGRAGVESVTGRRGSQRAHPAQCGTQHRHPVAYLLGGVRRGIVAPHDVHQSRHRYHVVRREQQRREQLVLARATQPNRLTSPRVSTVD